MINQWGLGPLKNLPVDDPQLQTGCNRPEHLRQKIWKQWFIILRHCRGFFSFPNADGWCQSSQRWRHERRSSVQRKNRNQIHPIRTGEELKGNSKKNNNNHVKQSVVRDVRTETRRPGRRTGQWSIVARKAFQTICTFLVWISESSGLKFQSGVGVWLRFPECTASRTHDRRSPLRSWSLDCWTSSWIKAWVSCFFVSFNLIFS